MMTVRVWNCHVLKTLSCVLLTVKFLFSEFVRETKSQHLRIFVSFKYILTKGIHLPCVNIYKYLSVLSNDTRE